jgi:hypothetical protein
LGVAEGVDSSSELNVIVKRFIGLQRASDEGRNFPPLRGWVAAKLTVSE